MRRRISADICSMPCAPARSCVRCVFTTVDPEAGAFDPSGEPLRTLKTYRRGPKGITFGMNLIARGRGTLHVGDPVVVLD